MPTSTDHQKYLFGWLTLSLLLIGTSFPYQLLAHKLAVRKVVEVFFDGEKLILEAYWVYPPQDPQYDRLTTLLDSQRDGKVTEEEASQLARKEAHQTYFYTRIYLDHEPLMLKLEKAELRYYPQTSREKTPLEFWARWSTIHYQKQCPELLVLDRSRFDPVALRLVVQGECQLRSGKKRTLLLKGEQRSVSEVLIPRRKVR